MEIIAQNAKAIFIYLAVINIFIAVWFLLWPNSLIKANELLKKRVSFEGIDRLLNEVKDADSNILGRRKIVGIASLCLAVILILMSVGS